MDLSRFQEISLAEFPARFDLAKHSVHIWCTSLHSHPNCLHHLAATLSADEQVRANRFRFDRDRQGFIAGRGILRLLLGQYLEISPDAIQFTYSARGKPALAYPADSDIAFNVSHSQGLALYGITRDRQIGIDVEYIRPVDDLLQLAQRYFLPSEYTLMQSCSPEQQQQTFFRLWTCKEAFLKATGEGITGLKRVEVTLGEAIVSLNLDGFPAMDWTVLQLDPNSTYAAALAVQGKNLQLTQYWLNHGESSGAIGRGGEGMKEGGSESR